MDKTLRLFEVSIIVKFLTTKEKLTVLPLLNSHWLRLIYRHVVWPLFPNRSISFTLADFVTFFAKFKTLTGIIVPYFPGDLLSSSYLRKL